MNMRTIITFLLMLLFLSFNLKAQVNNSSVDFDSSYFLIATKTSGQNISVAIKMSERLLYQSANPTQKIKSLMLLATLYQRIGSYAQSLKYAVEAEEFAEEVGNIEWQIRIAGFLSTTFRNVGLRSEGRKYLNKAEKTNSANGNSTIIQMFVCQEKAYYEIDAKNWQQALKETNRAIKFYKESSTQGGDFMFEATNLELLGYCYLQLKEYALAEQQLKKAIDILKKQDTELKGFIYQSLGELDIQSGKYSHAKMHLDTALLYVETSQNFSLAMRTYNSLYNYYKIIGDNKNALFYQNKNSDLTHKYIELSNQVSDGLINKYNSTLTRRSNLLLWGAVLIVILFIGIVWSTIRSKKQRKKYLAYLEKKESTQPSIGSTPIDDHTDINNPQFIENKSPDESSDIDYTTATPYNENDLGDAINIIEEENRSRIFLMSPETEKKILKQLAKLEQQHFYLKNDVRLTYVSLKLKINPKYISYIINKYKKKDFNNYINELRVNYIIDKLHNNPEYLEYKISYLAEECGFSTHSKFATVFKAVTGLSPSAFVFNIKKDNN